MKHDFKQAQPLYLSMFDYMTERGIDNAFVLYSYAIFAAITEEEDWTIIKDYMFRAQGAQNKQKKKMELNKSTPNRSISFSYDLAEAGFFRQAAYQQETSSYRKGICWCNYALCRMMVYKDWNGAREYFLRGVNASPHDARIVRLFKILINDVDFMGLNTAKWSVYDECRLMMNNVECFEAHKEVKQD